MGQPDQKDLIRRTHNPIYNAWVAMKQRCYNTKSKVYKYYGARGIIVLFVARNYQIVRLTNTEVL